MITHAARTLHDLPASTPDGMPVARCGWQNDGHGIAVAWERRFVDCPMCLLMIDNVPVIPGTELPVRTPRRPDYVPEGHIYVPPEFRLRRRRAWNPITALAVWILIAAIIAAGFVLFVQYASTPAGSQPAPAPIIIVTPTTYGPPPA